MLEKFVQNPHQYTIFLTKKKKISNFRHLLDLKSYLFIQFEFQSEVIKPPLKNIDKSKKHFKRRKGGFILLDNFMTKQFILANNIDRYSARNVFSLGQLEVSIDKTQCWCKLVVVLRNC